VTAALAALYTRSGARRDVGAALPSATEGMSPSPVSRPESVRPQGTDPEYSVPAPAGDRLGQPDTIAYPSSPSKPLAPSTARLDTIAVVYPSPSKPLAPSTAGPGRPAPSAPKVVSRLGTTVTRTPSYYEAYADARAEMDEGLDYVDFRRVFAPSRFSSPDSIRAARRMVTAAGNILRVYRGREVMLEQTYRPGEPEGKGSLREAFEVAEASRGLLADVDSLYGILVAQEGEVRYRDNALSFRNARTARAYSDVRQRILRVLAGLGDPAESADRVTMPRLLRAFGSDRPPRAR